MKTLIFESFEQMLDTFRYFEEGTPMYFVKLSSDSFGKDVIIMEVPDEFFQKAKNEFDADTYNDYDYV